MLETHLTPACSRFTSSCLARSNTFTIVWVWGVRLTSQRGRGGVAYGDKKEGPSWVELDSLNGPLYAPEWLLQGRGCVFQWLTPSFSLT